MHTSLLRQRTLLRQLLCPKWRENHHLPRHIVTEAFYGNAAWRERLAAPVFKKIKMGKLVQSSVLYKQFLRFQQCLRAARFCRLRQIKISIPILIIIYFKFMFKVQAFPFIL